MLAFYFLLIIPIAITAYLAHNYNGRRNPWPALFLIPVSALWILVGTRLMDRAAANDTEYHGGWVVSSEWLEAWTEKVTYTTTDSKGNTQTHTTYVYHPDEYYVNDSNGYAISVSREKYVSLKRKFGNERAAFVLHLNQSSWGDGGRFLSDWPQTESTWTACISAHSWENRPGNSHSLYNFAKVDPKVYGLFDYPDIEDYTDQRSLLGVDDVEAERKLNRFNCDFGATRQVRLFVLIFSGKPIQAGIDQQAHWKNGNKNECVVCVGVNDGRIGWVHPFGWGNERLLVDLREDIAQQKEFSPAKVVAKATELVGKGFKRHEFTQYAYIRVDIPAWYAIIVVVPFILIQVGLTAWHFKES